MQSRQQKVKIIGVNGASVVSNGQGQLMAPGREATATTRLAIKDHHENVLGFDVLTGGTWRLPNAAWGPSAWAPIAPW